MPAGPVTKKIMLQEAAQNIRRGLYSHLIDFLPDEYIVLRPPRSRPSEWLDNDDQTWMKLKPKADNDEAKVAFLAKVEVDTTIWAIADWNWRGPDGQVLPVPTVEDRASWKGLTEDQKDFIYDLILETYSSKNLMRGEETEETTPSNPSATNTGSKPASGENGTATG